MCNHTYGHTILATIDPRTPNPLILSSYPFFHYFASAPLLPPLVAFASLTRSQRWLPPCRRRDDDDDLLLPILPLYLPFSLSNSPRNPMPSSQSPTPLPLTCNSLTFPHTHDIPHPSLFPSVGASYNLLPSLLENPNLLPTETEAFYTTVAKVVARTRQGG